MRRLMWALASVLVATLSSGCGSNSPGPNEPTSPTHVELNIVGEWPLAAEEWFDASYRLEYSGDLPTDCSPVGSCPHGYFMIESFEPDGTFIVPRTTAICSGEISISASGVWHPPYRERSCTSVVCSGTIQAPINCTSEEQFLTVVTLEPESCSPPPPPEVHTLDITVDLGFFDLEKITWNLRNDCSVPQRVVASGAWSEDSSMLRIITEVECSAGFELQPYSVYSSNGALTVTGTTINGSTFTQKASIRCTSDPQTGVLVS